MTKQFMIILACETFITAMPVDTDTIENPTGVPATGLPTMELVDGIWNLTRNAKKEAQLPKSQIKMQMFTTLLFEYVSRLKHYAEAKRRGENVLVVSCFKNWNGCMIRAAGLFSMDWQEAIRDHQMLAVKAIASNPHYIQDKYVGKNGYKAIMKLHKQYEAA